MTSVAPEIQEAQETSKPGTELTAEIAAMAQLLERVRKQVASVVVGQEYMIDRILLALIADGHILIEGLPGLAKTTAVKTVAAAVNTGFSRVQFTPDLLPADLTGTEIYRPASGDFVVKKGPIFTNLLLADEINRAPAKVQSALLEAMQERQVTIGDETHILPAPFLVLATQNPIEQEGTYPLPEAQVDRFMLKLNVGYPTMSEEREIMRRVAKGDAVEIQAALEPEDLMAMRKLADSVYVDPKVEEYIVNIVFATRDPGSVGLHDLETLIDYGASPRASIYLFKAARVYAFMQGRAFVTPQDIKTIGPDILRHRLLLSYEAEARDLSADDLVARIFDTVDVP